MIGKEFIAAKELVLSESTPHELKVSGLEPQSIQVEDALHESVRVEPIVFELLLVCLLAHRVWRS